MDFTERISLLSLDYLAQALSLTPTDVEFVGWVDHQPLPVRPLLYLAGPAKCWAGHSPSYQASVLESRGVSFVEFLLQRLSEADYLRWVGLFATTTLARNMNEYGNEDGDY